MGSERTSKLVEKAVLKLNKLKFFFFKCNVHYRIAMMPLVSSKIINVARYTVCLNFKCEVYRQKPHSLT